MWICYKKTQFRSQNMDFVQKVYKLGSEVDNSTENLIATD